VYVYTMERTQIYLTEAEREALDRRATKSGQTRSHVIREAIAAYLQHPDKNDLEQAITESAGAWKRGAADDVDGATYVERLRAGRRWQMLYPEWGPAEKAPRPAKAKRTPRTSSITSLRGPFEGRGRTS
jgi:predicted DNA-binding protein